MTSTLFTPRQIGPIEIANRIVVSPMCQYSAVDGCPNEWHRIHLGTMARSGAGLVTVEATAPERRGRITHNCLGLYSDDCERAFADILSSVRAVSDVPLAIQIGHAGRKASSRRPWEGGGPLQPDEAPWETLSPSGIPLTENGPATRAMTEADIAEVIDAHVDAARRAARLGFEMLELHGGHGYLLSSFLSPLSNRREDAWGGSLENRMRFPLEVLRAIRAVWPQERALAIKYNGTDWADGGFVPEEAVMFARAVAEAGADMVTLSGGGVVLSSRPPVAPGYQLEAARRVRAEELGVTVGAVGMIYAPEFAEQIVSDGSSDTVALARAFLFNPRWAYHAATMLGAEAAYPPPYERAHPDKWPPALELLDAQRRRPSG
ncbi:oxidoreductase [Rhodobacteraceae bacterium WD3A24]|nr:oxidoreductase [Rhodobacteraceae bacterium WD3A24]